MTDQATKRVFNFSPGPAVLPEPVLQQARDELLALPGVGMSVLEISHRSKTFDAVRDVPFDRVITVCGHANEK